MWVKVPGGLGCTLWPEALAVATSMSQLTRAFFGDAWLQWTIPPASAHLHASASLRRKVCSHSRLPTNQSSGLTLPVTQSPHSPSAQALAVNLEPSAGLQEQMWDRWHFAAVGDLQPPAVRTMGCSSESKITQFRNAQAHR